MPVYLGSVWILTCGRSGLQEGVAPGQGQGWQALGEGKSQRLIVAALLTVGRAGTVSPPFRMRNVRHRGRKGHCSPEEQGATGSELLERSSGHEWGA